MVGLLCLGTVGPRKERLASAIRVAPVAGVVRQSILVLSKMSNRPGQGVLNLEPTWANVQ